MWARQLLILFLGFVAGVLLAELLGAKNLGTAVGVGQLTFAATLVWVLMTDSDSGGA
jgi:hypothetical protein